MPIGGDNIGGGLGDVPVTDDYYCNQGDLETRIGVQTLGQLTNDNAGSNPDELVVVALCKKAYDEINSPLASIYTVPFDIGDDTPDIINQIATDMACYFAMQRRFTTMEMPKQWQEAYDMAMDKIDRLTNGTLTIPGVSPNALFGQVVPPTSNPQANFYDRGEASNWGWF